jgi:hypothetical protein
VETLEDLEVDFLGCLTPCSLTMHCCLSLTEYFHEAIVKHRQLRVECLCNGR